MKIHEYQGKEVLAKHGVAVPRGIVITEAEAARLDRDRRPLMEAFMARHPDEQDRADQGVQKPENQSDDKGIEIPERGVVPEIDPREHRRGGRQRYGVRDPDEQVPQRYISYKGDIKI